MKEFALPLMVGIACGAYSSVCITGPAVVCHENKTGKETVIRNVDEAGAFAPAFLLLAFEILRLIKNFKIKNMVYFIY